MAASITITTVADTATAETLLKLCCEGGVEVVL